MKPTSPLKDPSDSNSYLNDTGKKIIGAIGGVISPDGGLGRFGETMTTTDEQVKKLEGE